MKRTAIYLTIGIVFLAALALLIIWPVAFKTKIGNWDRSKFKLGLDLQGGSQIVYQADMSKVASKDQAQALDGLINVIRNRIDALGVSEPVIQSTKVGGKQGVIVELPGISNVSQALQVIGKTAQLDFREQVGSGQNVDFKSTGLTGADLKKADVTFDNNGNPQVSLEFNSTGAKKFAAITQKNLNKPVAIYLDNQPVSVPTVQSVIKDGKAVITGQFNITEAKQLAIQLNAGALPVPISVVEQENVGATLGTDSVKSSLFAGLIGMALIFIFMIAYYRLPGILASLALTIYVVLALALFKLIPVTLTLAGIAGFVLSIGMAVDANILIFERLKEELREGKTLGLAIEEGFRRAWSSIRDSNISSLITALILFLFGSGIIRGFALTLSIGILVSMFTAITITRTFLRLVVGGKLTDRPSWFGVKKEQIKIEGVVDR